jgi:hypothetical protein
MRNNINKMDRLLLALDELQEHNGHVDVICFSEHYMREYEIKLLKLPGFKMAEYFCRKKENRGGV